MAFLCVSPPLGEDEVSPRPKVRVSVTANSPRADFRAPMEISKSDRFLAAFSRTLENLDSELPQEPQPSAGLGSLSDTGLTRQLDEYIGF